MRASGRLATLLLIIAGLGTVPASAAPAAAAHRTINPCSLLSLSDARHVLGSTARRAAHRPLGLFSSCTYATPRPYRFLQVLAATSAGIGRQERGKTAATTFVETMDGSPGNAVTIRGLGNRAFFDKAIGELWVLKGDVIFEMNGSFPAKSALAIDEKAARLALKHL